MYLLLAEPGLTEITPLPTLVNVGFEQLTAAWYVFDAWIPIARITIE